MPPLFEQAVAVALISDPLEQLHYLKASNAGAGLR